MNRRKLLSLVDEKQVEELVCDMCRIPSYTREEKAMAEFIGARMERAGMEVSFQEVEKNRPQVIGCLKGKVPERGRSLMFNGHLDHNPVVAGWSVDPYGAVIRDGWLYGVGAVNMKAGNAAALAAMETVARHGLPVLGDVTFAGVVGELQGGIGTQFLLGQNIRTDGAIVPEPTELKLIIRHAGVSVWRITLKGRAKHYTGHLKGVHAIEKMVALLNRLGLSQVPMQHDGWIRFRPLEGFEGLPQFNIGAIEGGLSDSYHKWRAAIMPDRCYILIDIRFTPAQTVEALREDLQALLSDLKAQDPDFDADVEVISPPDHSIMPPLNVPQSEPVVQVMAHAYRQVTGTEPEIGGFPPTLYCGSDTAHLAAAGIQSVMVGPGGKFITIPDERVLLDDVVKASRMYLIALAEFCGVSDV